MKKSRFVAIALALFLGGLGAHKFYLRRPGAGIFYLLISFSSTRILGFTIGALLGVMDAIAMMMMDDRTFDRRYNWSKMKSGYKPKRTIQKRPSTAPRRQRTTTQYQKRSNPHKRKGSKLLSSYDIKEAKEEYLKAKEISPRDAEIYWKLACIYSLEEETRKSFEHLDAAIELGYDKRALHSEDLLAFIRVQPAFDRFLKNGYKYVYQRQDDDKPNVVVTKEKEKIEQKER